jgi:ribosomal protein S18 acetylase RimI-like enzyme
MQELPMDDEDGIRIELVKTWEKEEIVQLYRAGGWWKEWMDPSLLQELISGSYIFSVAVDTSSGKPVGMGRVISDGTSDAYIQDVIVLPDWRNKAIGRMIVSALLESCLSRGISWIGLIAQPGTEDFYRSLGFKPMKGHVPMLFQIDEKDKKGR